MLPTNIIDLRYNIATDYLNGVESVSKLCQTYNTTRKTIHKWVKRLLEWGKEGLKDLPRAPKRVWNKKPKELEETVCSLFRQGYSPEEIYLKLRDKLCEKTVYNILERNNLPRKEKKKKREYKRYEYKEPNQLWHVDFTEFRIKGYGKFYIVVILDDYSRFIVGFRVVKRKTAENCLEVLREAIERYSKPESVLTDNGKQFVSKLYKDYLEKEGIKHRRTRPYNPKCNGKIERWFRTLKEPLRKKWFSNSEEFVREVNKLVDKYNHKPKRILNWKTPRERYI